MPFYLLIYFSDTYLAFLSFALQFDKCPRNTHNVNYIKRSLRTVLYIVL